MEKKIRRNYNVRKWQKTRVNIGTCFSLRSEASNLLISGKYYEIINFFADSKKRTRIKIFRFGIFLLNAPLSKCVEKSTLSRVGFV